MLIWPQDKVCQLVGALLYEVMVHSLSSGSRSGFSRQEGSQHMCTGDLDLLLCLDRLNYYCSG